MKMGNEEIKFQILWTLMAKYLQKLCLKIYNISVFKDRKIAVIVSEKIISELHRGFKKVTIC